MGGSPSAGVPRTRELIRMELPVDGHVRRALWALGNEPAPFCVRYISSVQLEFLFLCFLFVLMGAIGGFRLRVW